jgi:hypothetical protein
MSTSFTLSTHWKSYDVFARQKISTFRSSRPAVLELAARYKDLVTQLRNPQAAHDPEADRLLFTEMCEVCLWGNATDLSLLTSLTYDDIQRLQGSEARRRAEKNILINDLPRVYDHLLAAKTQTQQRAAADRRVDIVLDNAGFELFVDLILAGYLLTAGLATTVVLHPKSIPWFVSDVLPADFAALLNALARPREFFETPADGDALLGRAPPSPLTDAQVDDLAFLFAEWSRFHAEGQLVLRPNRVWTGPGSYWRLPREAEALVADLREGVLTVFKGDLNYRKLVGDVSCLVPFRAFSRFVPSLRHLFVFLPPCSLFVALQRLDLAIAPLTAVAGGLGPDHAVLRGAGPAGAGVRAQRAGASDVQGRRGGGAEARGGREAEADGRWRRRLRGAEVGVEREMGGGVLLQGDVMFVPPSARPSLPGKQRRRTALRCGLRNFEAYRRG